MLKNHEAEQLEIIKARLKHYVQRCHEEHMAFEQKSFEEGLRDSPPDDEIDDISEGLAIDNIAAMVDYIREFKYYEDWGLMIYLLTGVDSYLGGPR